MPYLRDKRSPIPKSEAVSRVMSANRAKDSKPELTLRRALWHSGLRGYRLHRRIALTKSSPPYVVAASPQHWPRIARPERGVAVQMPFLGTDGVVLTQPGTPDLEAHPTKNHPVGEAPPPLLRKEGSLKSRRVASVRPDISFVGRRLAIFVHGCFWHRCPRCNYPLPKNNTEFWQAKFGRNVTRDARKRSDLKHLGWKVITALHSDCF